MIISAIVVAAGVGGEPGPLSALGGRPMVVHAVRALLDSDLVDHVVVLGRPEDAGAIAAVCTGLPVSVRPVAAGRVGTHALQRAGTGSGDGRVWRADVLLVHDAARPLAPAGLAVAVIGAVRDGDAAAVPVLPMSDTVKLTDDAGVIRPSPDGAAPDGAAPDRAALDRAALRVVQTPQAIRRELLVGPPLAAAMRLVERGTPVPTVPGDARAFAVRTVWDLELAELLLTGGIGP
jgi:2-C-methyl-D-erythritol 4-phosphate cytidylyltransferase